MFEHLYRWTRRKVRQYELAPLDTLEVGSRNVNGSVRDLFTGRYVGLDLVNGPGVDVTAPLRLHTHEWAARWPVVVCLETLEHDARPWETVWNIGAVTVDGGHLLLSVPSFMVPRHDFPNDYWRFSEKAIRVLLDIGRFELLDLDQLAGPTIGVVARRML